MKGTTTSNKLEIIYNFSGTIISDVYDNVPDKAAFLAKYDAGAFIDRMLAKYAPKTEYDQPLGDVITIKTRYTTSIEEAYPFNQSTPSK